MKYYKGWTGTSLSVISKNNPPVNAPLWIPLVKLISIKVLFITECTNQQTSKRTVYDKYEFVVVAYGMEVLGYLTNIITDAQTFVARALSEHP